MENGAGQGMVTQPQTHLEREKGERVLNQQPHQPLGVENELVPAGLLVSGGEGKVNVSWRPKCASPPKHIRESPCPSWLSASCLHGAHRLSFRVKSFKVKSRKIISKMREHFPASESTPATLPPPGPLSAPLSHVPKPWGRAQVELWGVWEPKMSQAHPIRAPSRPGGGFT